jgi:hypothetical protein
MRILRQSDSARAICHAEGHGFESHHPLLKGLQISRFGCLGAKRLKVRGKVRPAVAARMTLKSPRFRQAS